jgi:hypothetical protein
MHVGVGAHEPIYHRLRTGNSTAEEWTRWEREVSTENLDLLERLGITRAHIACTKGFGLEYEKPLIERAAKFCEQAKRRGMEVSIYVQGYPVYYETFLRERPEAEKWLGRTQSGDIIPWGGQTFRRFMDPACTAFHDYEEMLLTYVYTHLQPDEVTMDNTGAPWCWSNACRDSFRAWLRSRYDAAEARREFGIDSFDAVDLPRFHPVYFPPDAIRIVKDPVLQEWARWYSNLTRQFLQRMRDVTHRLAPGATFISGAGCDVLRYNTLFNWGVDFEDRFAVLDAVGTEESAWRPGVVESAPVTAHVVMDERSPDAQAARAESSLRVSTDARWLKICTEYGKPTGGSFWGEVDRASKLVAMSHYLAFAQNGHHVGTVGPLCAAPQMLDDIRDVIEWGQEHIEILTGREARYAPVAVWRGNTTTNFIRHRPVWEACAVEQMLFEQHVPFTILLDGVLERFLAAPGSRLLVLPGTACVSAAQVERITAFVQRGGALLLLGEAGTRDERTRLRQRYAFEHLFGGQVPNLEYYGPPHWVPELDFRRMPDRLEAKHGQGRVVALKAITSRTTLDLTRDPYMPERQVMVKDVLPPANEAAIMREVDALLDGKVVRVEAPRTTLCECWKRGKDLVVGCANLRKGVDGGPVTVHLGVLEARTAQVHLLLEKKASTLQVTGGRIHLPQLPHFAAVVVPGVLG